MLPIGTLMMEHRLIERMIIIIKDELKVIQEEKKVNPIFIDNIVDFLRTYADQTHHGKEEDILFRELKKKNLSDEQLMTISSKGKPMIFQLTPRSVIYSSSLSRPEIHNEQFSYAYTQKP